MRQNGLSVCSQTVMSERFFPVLPDVEELTIADSLDEHYGVGPSREKYQMACCLAVAEIGGFLIFEDGSEVVA